MKRMICVMAVALVAVGARCAAAAPVKVLMIGNSYSICVLHHLPAAAKASGVALDIASLYIGGCPLARHVANSEKPDDLSYLLTWNRTGEAQAAWPALQACVKSTKVLNRQTKQEQRVSRANINDVLSAEAWDIVSIQQASHESFHPESFHPWGERLIACVRARAPQAKIVVQETWSDQPESKRLARWGLTSATMYAQLHRCYADFAAAHGFKIIPTGTAVELARPIMALQRAGGDPHLDTPGEYLQALVWLGALFGANVTACPYAPANWPPARVTAFKHAAQRALQGERP